MMRVEKYRNERKEGWLSYVNFYSLAFLITYFLASDHTYSLDNYSIFKISIALILSIPCIISFVYLMGVINKRAKKLYTILVIILGIGSSYFLWVVLL